MRGFSELSMKKESGSAPESKQCAKREVSSLSEPSITCQAQRNIGTKPKSTYSLMQAPLELVGLGSSSSIDPFASWKMNGNGMKKEEREETPLQGEDESRRSSPP